MRLRRWAGVAAVTAGLVGGVLIGVATAGIALDTEAYSASEALGAEGYTWSEADGFVDADDESKPRLDPNGCGPGWIPEAVQDAADNPAGFAFKESCDKHDNCYSTYPIPKEYTAAQWRAKCDEDFGKSMNQYCDTVQGAKIVDKYKLVIKDKKVQWEKLGEIKWSDEAAQKHCRYWAKVYTEAVKKLGAAAFDKAQAAAKKKAEGKEEEEQAAQTT